MGGEAGRWKVEHELLAVLAELVDHNNRLTHAAWFKGKPPKALRVPRPGRDADKPRRVTPAQMAGALAELGKG